MTDNVLSLAMTGKSYFLCGKSYYRCRSPTTLTKDLKPTEVPKYVAFGTDGSWYRAFKQKDAKGNEAEVIARSDNFATAYPSLNKSLDELQLFSAPTCLSLGPNGYYFAHIGRKRLWKLPKDVEERLGNLAEYEGVWLGKGEKGPSYVAVRKGGGFSTDFHGKYGRLKEDVKAFGAPKVLAMNLENGEEYVAVWPNGKYRSCSSKACLPAEEAVAFFERVGFTKTAS